MRVSDVGGIDLRVESSISVSQSLGAPETLQPPWRLLPVPSRWRRPSFVWPTVSNDKDPPLAALEAAFLSNLTSRHGCGQIPARGPSSSGDDKRQATLDIISGGDTAGATQYYLENGSTLCR